MAKDILKEAIADAKAVREVALANAKAALEEAFTPKLQSMLSAKLSEELEEEYDEDETSEGMYYDEDEDMDEVTGMEMDEDDMDEAVEETTDESIEEEVEDLDEEIDLEEILNELELEESEEVSEETVAEGDEDITEGDEEITEEEVEEGYQSKPNATADDVQNVTYKVDNIYEGEDFDLDALLEEINNLDENNEDEVNEEVEEGLMDTLKKAGSEAYKNLFPDEFYDSEGKIMWSKVAQATGGAAAAAKMEGVEEELEETKAALETVRTELNEVNLLNSKLLYVNRIFKANTLDEAQKLRVVETLDKAETAKEAKLIYETIKDTFNVAKSKKESMKSKTNSLKEGLGMASKAAGTSTAPKTEVIAESTNMVSRFQKLANITINE